MIVYEATRGEFSQDVVSNQIEQRILDSFKTKLGSRVAKNEVDSWRNSLMYMDNALRGAAIPSDAGVAIEYKIPQTSNRVDFILTGTDEDDHDTAVIVELKQWSEVEKTDKDSVVRTFLGRGKRDTTHPSYQAWSYATLLRDFNEEAHDGKIRLRPCAYLHNLPDPHPLNDEQYKQHTARAPVFARNDADKLQAFLKRYIRKGDQKRILYRIESGRIVPSKHLADHLVSLLEGNREFTLIDNQMVIYETALDLAKKASGGTKQVMIVQGGPGTGKSVVAINLLVELTKQGKLVQYATRNAAPKEVWAARLAGTLTKTRIHNMFKGTGAYMEAEVDSIDALIVDEAHRLNEKSGFYGNQGDHQVKEIINTAKFSIFFTDDDQRVTLKDIGEASVLREFALSLGAEVTEIPLTSQFRCNGSDGYLNWLSNTLQIRETANEDMNDIDYHFEVFDSPIEMHDKIIEHNDLNNKSRVVAGYCWEWKSKKKPKLKDIVIPEFGYEARWNLDKDGSLWIIQENSVHEVGCVHTCQGLELDYVGVIIGPDLVVRDGEIVTDATKRHFRDKTIHGYKKWVKTEPVAAKEAADRIIKNTYRTLMTRGQKGCFVYSVDAETNGYFRALNPRTGSREADPTDWPLAADEPPDYHSD